MFENYEHLVTHYTPRAETWWEREAHFQEWLEDEVGQPVPFFPSGDTLVLEAMYVEHVVIRFPCTEDDVKFALDQIRE